MPRHLRTFAAVAVTALLLWAFPAQCASPSRTMPFPYVDRPRTKYTFKVTGTLGAPLLSPIANPRGDPPSKVEERTFMTKATVEAGPLRPDGTFELSLGGETTWSAPGESGHPEKAIGSKFTYRFVLDKNGRVLSTGTPGLETGHHFNAWDFLWSSLARVRPDSSPRKVSLGAVWTEEFSTSQSLSSVTVRTSAKSHFKFAQIEGFRGSTSARITEDGEALVTTYRAGESPHQTRLVTSGRIWADLETGLIRSAEWTVDASDLSRPQGGTGKPPRPERALTLTYNLLTYEHTR